MVKNAYTQFDRFFVSGFVLGKVKVDFFEEGLAFTLGILFDRWNRSDRNPVVGSLALKPEIFRLRGNIVIDSFNQLPGVGTEYG
jgi:hypothetical protein